MRAGEEVRVGSGKRLGRREESGGKGWGGGEMEVREERGVVVIQWPHGTLWLTRCFLSIAAIAAAIPCCRETTYGQWCNTIYMHTYIHTHTTSHIHMQTHT